MTENYFILNRETGKLELHFEKAAYAALSDAQKAEIKSRFLWGRRSGCWISRAKEPNLYWARQVAEALGLEDAGAEGERLPFAEQQARRQERAERRADRYEDRAAAADRRGEQLQAPIEKMHGDVAFFTQPNINTTAGRAFTRRREKMFAAWEKGFDEFRKSAYWQERAATARRTAAGAELQDKGFLQRRIDERQSSIRKRSARVREYEGYLDALEAGETPRDSSYGWEIKLTPEQITAQITADLDQLEALADELGYYQEALDALGGVTFSRDNLKKGDLLYLSRWREPVRYLRGGPKNFTYEFTLPHMTYADGSPMQGKAAYAEITRRAGEEPAPAEQTAPEVLTPEAFAALAAEL